MKVSAHNLTDQALRERIDAQHATILALHAAHGAITRTVAELCDYMYWRVESVEDKAMLKTMKHEAQSLYVPLPER